MKSIDKNMRGMNMRRDEKEKTNEYGNRKWNV